MTRAHTAKILALNLGLDVTKDFNSTFIDFSNEYDKIWKNNINLNFHFIVKVRGQDNEKKYNDNLYHYHAICGRIFSW